MDFDPNRDTDPASESEVDSALTTTNAVLAWLLTKEIGSRLAIMSGNGYHLYIPTNGWPNDDKHNRLAKAFIQMLAGKFSNSSVKIDTATSNPARLGKIPGCISRKGTETEDRIFRMVELAGTADVPFLSADDVEELCDAEGHSIELPRIRQKGGGLDPDFDVYGLAEWCGVTVETEFEKNGCNYYALDECPIAGYRHRGTSGKTCFIVGDSLGFECFSDDCSGLGIGDVLRKFNEDKGRYKGPLFLELDLSDEFPVDDIDDIEKRSLTRVRVKKPNVEGIESASTVVASAPPKDQPDRIKVEGEIYLTDLGNAKRFVECYGNDVRYCFHTKKWYVWTGHRWTVDDKGTVTKKAKRVVQSILKEAAEIDDEETRKAYVLHERKSEAKNRLDAMVGLAQSEGDVPVRLADFDRAPMLLNTVGGTIDLERGTVDVHRRSDMITKLSPVAYDPSAQCPTWERFLNQVTAGDKPLRDYLQRCIGYSLTGDTKEHALFLIYGKGANGKSTFLEVLRYVLGDYAQTADFASFMFSKNQGVRNDIAKLNGARLVTATESESGKRMSEAIVKQLTGGDTVTARFLYCEHFEFIPQFKLWLGTNHKPKIVGADDGIWRRIRLIPFTVQIPKEQQDKDLSKKLKAEAAGILNWALEGLRNWLGMGLAEPDTVTDATSQYRADQDVLQHFIDARCKVGVGARVKGSSLYGSYKLWAEIVGEFIMSERDFGNAMSDRAYSRYRTSSERGWEGIALATEEGEQSGFPSNSPSIFDELSV